MNGYQRICAALRGEWADTVPIMLHNFLMAAAEAGVSMRHYRSDAAAVARCFIESVERYGYDGIVVDVDTATLAGALGAPVDFPEDLPARCKGGRFASLDEVAGLDPPDISGYAGVQVWLEATARLRDYFGDEVSIRGNCDQAPFSLAALLRSPEEWLTDLMDPDKHDRAHGLLDYCAQASEQFIRLMAKSGAHMVSNGDSWAGLVSPRLYRTFALPYEQGVAGLAHDLGLPWLLHICGKTDRILAEMVESGADGLELDQKTNARLARDHLRGRATFVGNIDPSGVLACGSPALVEARTRELCETFAGVPGFIVNAGCAIPATTPSENIRAMIATARSYRSS